MKFKNEDGFSINIDEDDLWTLYRGYYEGFRNTDNTDIRRMFCSAKDTYWYEVAKKLYPEEFQ